MATKVNSLMKVSPNGIAQIKVREGFRSKAYRDTAGVWTIGYGRTIGVKKGDVSTREAEEAWLVARANDKYGKKVRDSVTVPLNQNQYDALVSLVYNIGEGAFAKSTLLKKLNRSNYASVPAQMQRYIYSGGKRTLGLVRRRAMESEQWLTPVVSDIEEQVTNEAIPDPDVDADDHVNCPPCVCSGQAEVTVDPAGNDVSVFKELFTNSNTFKAALAKLGAVAATATAYANEISGDPKMMVLFGLMGAMAVYIMYLRYKDIKEGS